MTHDPRAHSRTLRAALTALACVAALGAATPARAAVAYVSGFGNTALATANPAATTWTSPNISVTPGAGTNRVLVVVVTMSLGSTGTFNTGSATYNGATATQVVLTTASALRGVWIGYFREANLPAGAANLVVTVSSSQSFNGVSVYAGTYSGVNQTTTITGSGQVAGAATTITLGAAVSSNAGGAYVAAVARSTTSTGATLAPTTYTTRVNDSTSTGVEGTVADKLTPSAASETTSSTQSGSTSAQALGVVSLNPAPAGTITLGNNSGTEAPNATICAAPAAATYIDFFTLLASAATNVNGVTTTFSPALPAGLLGLLEVTNDAGTAQGSLASPSGATPAVTGMSFAAPTGAAAQYRLRITPSATATSSGTFTATVTGVTTSGGFTLAGSDAASATLVVDGQASPDVTGATATPSAGTVTASWTNPAPGTVPATDFGGYVVVLGNTVAITGVPAEGTSSYAAGAAVGADTVVCAGNLTTCARTGLGGSQIYYLKIFTRDGCANWSAGVQVNATTPAAVPGTAAGVATAAQGTGATPTVAVSAPYTNDTNGNNTLSYRYRTPTGTGTWTASTALPHSASPYAFGISGLACGASYDVEVTYVDPDGVTGTAVQTLSNVVLTNCTLPSTGPTLTANSCSQVTAQVPFTNDANANGTVAFDRGSSASGPWTATSCTAVGGASPRSCVDTGASGQSTYWYRATFSDPDGVGGTNPVVSASSVTTPSCGTLTVANGTNTNSTISQSQTAALDAFTLTASAGTASITQVRVNLPTVTNVQGLSIRSTSACGGTTFGSLNAPTPGTNAVNVTGLGAGTTATSVWVCVTSAAVVTASSSITGTVSGVTAPGWAVTNGNNASGTVTINPPGTATLAVTAGTMPAAATVAAGSSGTVVGRVVLTATGGTATLDALAVSNTGTALAASDVSTLSLYNDTSGAFVGAGVWSASTSHWVFRGLALDVAAGSPITLRLVLGLNLGATGGRTFVMNSNVPADVTVVAPATVSNTATIAGNAFTIGAGVAAGSTNTAAPMVSIINPGSGKVVSPNNQYKVQIRVFNPGAQGGIGGIVANSVALSTDNGATWPTCPGSAFCATQNANYNAGTPTVTGTVYEVIVTGQASGGYTLRARASNGVVANVLSEPVSIVVGAALRGDGNLLVRDNSSQLCSDCHALQTHSSEAVGTKYGSWAVACRDCHAPHGARNITLVNETITPPSASGVVQTAKNVGFVTKTGDSNAAGWDTTNKRPTPTASFVNSDSSGPCQVCHTRTQSSGGVARWRNTGNSDTHYTSAAGTQPCTNCHSHIGGFAGGESQGGAACSGCHGTIWSTVTGATAGIVSKHTLGNVAGTNDSPTDTTLGWSAVTNLADNPAAQRSCVNMCHSDHPHDLTSPALSTHDNNLYLDPTTQAARGNGSANRTSTFRVKTDFDSTNNTGMCAKCHAKPVAAGRQTITEAAFGASAHDFTSTAAPAYTWQYTLHDGGTTLRNCTKCHASRTEGNTPGMTGTAVTAVHGTTDPLLLSGTKNPAGAAANFVCYNCHGSTASPAAGAQGNRSGKDIQSQIAHATTAGQSGHPANADTVHDSNAEYANAAFGNALGVAAGAGQRHANCMDCHDPHEAQPGGRTYTTGTATVSGTAVTGVGTQWSSYYVGAGFRLNSWAAGTWATISAVGGPTSLTLAAAGPSNGTGAAYTITSTTNLAGPALQGAWGAQLSTNPAFFTAPAAGNMTKKVIASGTDLEATLCLKCHTAYYGTLPNAPSSSPAFAETDVAREFNPANAGTWSPSWTTTTTAGSFHPVLANAGGNLGAINLANLVTTSFPWKTSGTTRNVMSCSDCHESDVTTDPNGPHGSAARFILKGPNTTWNATVTLSNASPYMPNGTFCANCHSQTYASTRTVAHTNGQHTGTRGYCFMCHVAIPHGSMRPGLLSAQHGGPNGSGGTGVLATDQAPYNQSPVTQGLGIGAYPPNQTTSWGNGTTGATNTCGCGSVGTTH